MDYCEECELEFEQEDLTRIDGFLLCSSCEDFYEKQTDFEDGFQEFDFDKDEEEY